MLTLLQQRGSRIESLTRQVTQAEDMVTRAQDDLAERASAHRGPRSVVPGDAQHVAGPVSISYRQEVDDLRGRYDTAIAENAQRVDSIRGELEQEITRLEQDRLIG
jgi:hypothetical protein